MQKIYYRSGANRAFFLNNKNFKLLNIDDIFNLEYETDISNGTLSITNKIKTIELEFDVITTREKTWQEVINELIEVTDGDIANNRVGSLFLDDYRLDCYLSDVRLKNVNTTQFYATGTIKLISNFIWRKVVNFTYEAIETSAIPKQYPVNYPYSYSLTTANQYLNNASYRPAFFRIEIRGAVNNPSISIGNNTYNINEFIEQNETMSIIYDNEATKTIMKWGFNPTYFETNCFNKRDKNDEFFKKIEPGNNNVVWDGSFGFEITLFEERGMPPCN